MEINRFWSMPSGDTFSIKPIKELIKKYVDDCQGLIVDPFVRNSPFKHLCLSNDLDESIEADYNIDALDFMKQIEDNSVDLMLYDPPYSVRQVSEIYRKLGKSVNMETTQSSFWTRFKKEISRCVKKDGFVISCGWNSGGIGKTNGFKIVEILLVAHGGIHNDTIVTVEKRLSKKCPIA